MIPGGTSGRHRRRLVRAAVDAYHDWRDECSAASDAYRRWADAGEAGSKLAWQVYEAALEREQRASSLYADLAQQVADLPPCDFELGTDRQLRENMSPGWETEPTWGFLTR